MNKSYFSYSKRFTTICLGKLRSCSPRMLLFGVCKAISLDKKDDIVDPEKLFNGDSFREHLREFLASFQENLMFSYDDEQSISSALLLWRR